MSSEAFDQRGTNENVPSEASSAAHSQAVSREVAKRLLLSKINLAQGLLGETARYIKLPDVEEASKAALAGKTIVMVDDTAGQLARWHPVLEVATAGYAALVWHREQSAQMLVAEITSKKPDVILLDFSLANGIRGTELLSPLKNALPEAKIIGFSAESSNNQELQVAGAHASAKKSSPDDDAVMRAIADVISPAASTESSALRDELLSLTPPAIPDEQR